MHLVSTIPNQSKPVHEYLESHHGRQKSFLIQVCISAVALACFVPAFTDDHESRWERWINHFEDQDAVDMPPEGAVLFVGSSSIVFWKGLQETMAPLKVINRGFGGSQMSDLNEFRDRIVTKYKPRAIVIYEGDNDVAAGKSVDEILAAYDDFIAHVEKELPQTDICFIAIKPSIAREQMWSTMVEVNAGLRKRADKSETRCYLDIAAPMMDSDGAIKTTIFVDDGLHMNEEGYAIWNLTVRPILIERYGPESDRPATVHEGSTTTQESENGVTSDR